MEARDLEYKAWARVQSLKSSLDERNLESRVKTANEAEAISQQRLAAAEAEIARLRQKLEVSKRLDFDATALFLNLYLCSIMVLCIVFSYIVCVAIWLIPFQDSNHALIFFDFQGLNSIIRCFKI